MDIEYGKCNKCHMFGIIEEDKEIQIFKIVINIYKLTSIYKFRHIIISWIFYIYLLILGKKIEVNSVT